MHHLDPQLQVPVEAGVEFVRDNDDAAEGAS
jgi:hypothetical protein